MRRRLPRGRGALREVLPEKRRPRASAESPGMAGGFVAAQIADMDHSDLHRLTARARRLSRSEDEAQDLTQEVLLAYLERRATGADITRPLPYMMTALRHAARRRRATQLTDAGVDVDALPGLDDPSLHCLCHEVLAAIDALPPRDRVLLRQVAAGETQPAALARVHHVPVGTIMSRLARARARLRRALGVTRLF